MARPSTYPVLDSVVLDTLQASAADLILSSGTLSVNGLATAIPLRNVVARGFTKYAYAAGTPRAFTCTVGSPATNTLYKLRVTSYVTQGTPLSSADEKYVETKDYAYYTGASDTGTTVAAGFAALINADGSSFVTASPSSNVLTVTATDAQASFVLLATDPAQASILVIAQSTAYVQPEGTYAVVSKVNPNATNGNHYATYIWTIESVIPGKALNNSGNESIIGEVIIYANASDSNFSAFDTEMLAIQAGTHSPDADYNGVNYLS